jgi:eukaryotic-like serine/threonine-protein kinase
VLSSPVAVNGVVYIGSQDKYLYALDGAAGFAYWRSLAGDLDPLTGTLGANPVNSRPSLDNTFVYITAGSFIYAFRIKDGTRAWRYRTGNDLDTTNLSSPIVAGDLVYFGSSDKNVYAINT